MGRRSKLTEKQWADIQARLLAGDRQSALAREYKVSDTAIRKRLSSQCEQIKSVADQVFTAENALKELPISSQIAALSLVDDLRSISTHLSGAARYGASTAHRLAGIANAQVCKVDDVNPMESQETLQAISALTKMSNDAAKTGMDLIIASKRDPLPDTNEAHKITGFRVVAR